MTLSLRIKICIKGNGVNMKPLVCYSTKNTLLIILCDPEYQFYAQIIAGISYIIVNFMIFKR